MAKLEIQSKSKKILKFLGAFFLVLLSLLITSIPFFYFMTDMDLVALRNNLEWPILVHIWDFVFELYCNFGALSYFFSKTKSLDIQVVYNVCQEFFLR